MIPVECSQYNQATADRPGASLDVFLGGEAIAENATLGILLERKLTKRKGPLTVVL